MLSAGLYKPPPAARARVIPSRRKAKAPLPASLPGRFFLLEYVRDSGYYRLTVDDGNMSSFNFGSDIETMMRQFRRWGCFNTGCSAIDTAREFGAAQGIPGEGRVISVKPSPKKPELVEAGRGLLYPY